MHETSPASPSPDRFRRVAVAIRRDQRPRLGRVLVRLVPSLVLLTATVVLANCTSDDSERAVEAAPADAPAFAIAELGAASGSQASGSIIFTAVDDGLLLSVEAKGLGEGGSHGFHIHEVGDCTAPDATSAGGHFDPDGTKLGDLENLVTGPDGSSFVDVRAPGLTLWGSTDVTGRSVVIHDADDPDIRIACGVIEAIGR